MYADTTYSVTVTDDNGCELFANISLTQPTSIVSYVSGTNIQCNGDNDGEAIVISSGGNGTHSYLWSDMITTNDTITGLSADIMYYVKEAEYNEARKKGNVRLEGKTYEVQDGDIITFRFNV